MMSLGEIIRQRRKELGLTQDQVSARADITKPYLSGIETGRVKNPPSDGVIARLERALSFPAGELRKLAHLARTPPDVRDEHEQLAAEVEKLRSLLRRVAAEGTKGPDDEGSKTGGIDLDAIVKRMNDTGGNISEAISAGRAVPVINDVAAGYPYQFTDLDYPASVADEYVRCPGVHDGQAFAARVVGDSMEPKYVEGDIVIFSPNREPMGGDDCFVRFEDGSTTFKRLCLDGGEIRLEPLNRDYPAHSYPPEDVTGLWPAVMKMQRLT